MLIGGYIEKIIPGGYLYRLSVGFFTGLHGIEGEENLGMFRNTFGFLRRYSMNSDRDEIFSKKTRVPGSRGVYHLFVERPYFIPLHHDYSTRGPLKKERGMNNSDLFNTSRNPRSKSLP